MKSDNELIAAFMGRTRMYESTHEIFVLNLKYDHDWSWLMPVVEKIINHVYEEVEETDWQGYTRIIKDVAYPRTFGMRSDDGLYMFRFNRSQLHTNETLIGVTYEAVVEWIKWYNEQKSSELRGA